jgi:predicted DNA-binding transcriptional regulator YafY
MNAKMLAEECQVTERTIYRDLISLTEIEIPIYYDKGYKLASDNFLPPLNFTLDEYNFLKQAIESSPLVNTEKYKNAFKSVSAKIENSLSENAKQKRRYSSKSASIIIPQHHNETNLASFYGQLEDAISQSNQIKIKYNSISTGITDRIVESYFIIFRGRTFYFVAFCHSRNEVRTFRVNRIIELEPTGKFFDRNPDINPIDYFDKSWSVYSGDEVGVEAVFSGTAARVITTSHHHDNEQIEQINENTVRYKVTTRGIEEIQRWLLGFGEEVEIISPPELKSNLSDIGKFLSEKYSSDN